VSENALLRARGKEESGGKVYACLVVTEMMRNYTNYTGTLLREVRLRVNILSERTKMRREKNCNEQ